MDFPKEVYAKVSQTGEEVGGDALRKAPTRDRPYDSCRRTPLRFMPQGRPYGSCRRTPVRFVPRGRPYDSCRRTPVRFLPEDARTICAARTSLRVDGPAGRVVCGARIVFSGCRFGGAFCSGCVTAGAAGRPFAVRGSSHPSLKVSSFGISELFVRRIEA